MSDLYEVLAIVKEKKKLARTKLSRGCIAMVDGIWYIVVDVVVESDGKISVDCICDHANNRFTWEAETLDVVASPEQVLAYKNQYGWTPEYLELAFKYRDIPYGIMWEVQNGDKDGFYDDEFERNNGL